jgi:hypothetical protein
MSDEDFKTFIGDVTDFLTSIEEAVKRLKDQIAKLLGSFEARLISSPKPVSEDDPAIKWLKTKLEEVRAKHPESSYIFIRSPDGKIAGLKVQAMDVEVLADYEAPAKWAFEKASQRPGI